MFGSFPIARVFGITVRVHWMWLALLIGIAMFWPNEPFATLLNTLVLFAVVFLHELGHSLMAKYFKIQVVDITLWPLGGMARMTAIPEKPHVELLVALAGPAVNFALAALALAVMIARGALADGELFQKLTLSMTGVVAWFFAMNLVMGVFNLIPAFPMDGGRVLRAFLAVFSDWLTATRRAVAVGKVFAVLMIVGGIVFPLGYALPLVGLFIWWQGSMELLAVRVRHGDIPGMARGGPRPTTFSVEKPVAKPDERPDDPSGARRPTDPPIGPARGPWSKEDIEKLENFRGRLRGPNEPNE
jgi:stage IV sporulation protein FB